MAGHLACVQKFVDQTASTECDGLQGNKGRKMKYRCAQQMFCVA